MERMQSANILLHLTNECTNRCRHCYVSSGTKAGDELTIEEIQFLANIWDKTYKKVRIALSGGEPTLKEGFAEILKIFGENKKFKISMVTNGAMVPLYLVLLKKYKVSGDFTFYGAGETHDRFAHREGAFQDLIKASKLLPDWGLRLHCHKDVLGKASEVVRLVKDLARNSIDIARPVPVGRGKHIEILSDEEFIQFCNSIRNQGIKVRKFESTVSKALEQKIPLWLALLMKSPLSKYIEESFVFDKDKLLKNRKIGYCELAWANRVSDMVIVSYNGDVFSPCCFGLSNPKLFIGNIRRNKWGEIKIHKPKLNFTKIVAKFGDNKKLYHNMDKCALCAECWKEL